MQKSSFLYYRPKAVFLDRDGVINPLIERENKRLTSPWNVKEFNILPDVSKTLVNLRKNGFMSFIVTNQPGIADGDMTQQNLDNIVFYMREKLCFNEIHAATDKNTIYYKPNNGTLERFINQYDVIREKSFMIGDRWKDIVPGHNSGLTTILVGNTEYDPPEEYKHIKPNYKVNNIYEAYCLIMEIDNARI